MAVELTPQAQEKLTGFAGEVAESHPLMLFSLGRLKNELTTDGAMDPALRDQIVTQFNKDPDAAIAAARQQIDKDPNILTVASKDPTKIATLMGIQTGGTPAASVQTAAAPAPAPAAPPAAGQPSVLGMIGQGLEELVGIKPAEAAPLPSPQSAPAAAPAALALNAAQQDVATRLSVLDDNSVQSITGFKRQDLFDKDGHLDPNNEWTQRLQHMDDGQLNALNNRMAAVAPSAAPPPSAPPAADPANLDAMRSDIVARLATLAKDPGVQQLIAKAQQDPEMGHAFKEITGMDVSDTTPDGQAAFINKLGSMNQQQLTDLSDKIKMAEDNKELAGFASNMPPQLASKLAGAISGGEGLIHDAGGLTSNMSSGLMGVIGSAFEGGKFNMGSMMGGLGGMMDGIRPLLAKAMEFFQKIFGGISQSAGLVTAGNNGGQQAQDAVDAAAAVNGGAKPGQVASFDQNGQPQGPATTAPAVPQNGTPAQRQAGGPGVPGLAPQGAGG